MIEGGMSRTQDGIIVVALGVVIVLRTKNMKPVIEAFGLEQIQCFLQASNVQNHAAFAFNVQSEHEASHLMLASP